MSINTEATESSNGWLNGLLGVIIFSGSLPATRIAVLDLDPFFVTVARATIAGILALIVLLINKEKFPQKTQFLSLGIVALGVVIGFPLLSALALRYVTSAHSIVFVGILPVSTAVFGIIRGGERPRPVFWIFSILGSLLVVGYALKQGISSSPIGDILMLLSVILCGLGYAEGGKLSKTLGGWQVISWALVFSLPVALPLTYIFLPTTVTHVSIGAWTSLAYVSLFSMFIGFIFWYKGLAQGGIASIGQLQLLQPFFGLILAASLLHEEVNIGMLFVTIGVILCVGGAKKFAK
ncbi:DMT family transporter [Sphingobacterium sp. BIGb0165]|uniref:DMT family transporter n=1 Tax=Sphingobacterium sp. BIGb0165 TaxID=2940615 RepID=UPI0021698C50|nr:DMT family transporter [Sphingobacterium sp. BIGb0165]MCS4227154.1 drug/metabolite transporter (DMT)-like permease [Sphingobacterium sp. BIGb0165]